MTVWIRTRRQVNAVRCPDAEPQRLNNARFIFLLTESVCNDAKADTRNAKVYVPA